MYFKAQATPPRKITAPSRMIQRVPMRSSRERGESGFGSGRWAEGGATISDKGGGGGDTNTGTRGSIASFAAGPGTATGASVFAAGVLSVSLDTSVRSHAVSCRACLNSSWAGFVLAKAIIPHRNPRYQAGVQEANRATIPIVSTLSDCFARASAPTPEISILLTVYYLTIIGKCQEVFVRACETHWEWTRSTISLNGRDLRRSEVEGTLGKLFPMPYPCRCVTEKR